MPITIIERPEVLTDASRLSSDPPLLIPSNAVELLGHELRRYCRREVSGRSFLIAGHRGAGKTTLVLHACQRVFKDSEDGHYPLRPLLVMLQGPNLLPNEEDELPAAENGEKKDAASKDSGVKKISPMENVLRQITLGLYRALAREISQAFRRHAMSAAAGPESATGISRGELMEFAAALELELDEYPGKSRLRHFWRTEGVLETGVLWPGSPTAPSHRPADQGLRELVALCSACEAYRRISGTFTSKQEDKQGAKATEERKIEADLKGKEILGPIMPVLIGALAGTGVLATGVGDGPGAAFAGTFAAIASAFAFKYSSSRSRERSATREDLFIPDLSVATLDRVLPVLIERLHAAGLAPVFVIDELDKVDRLSTRIPEMIRRLKKLVAENAFFCFLTDRTYYEEMRERELKKPYSIEHTYFTHQLFIIFRHRDLHKFLDDVLKSPDAPPDPPPGSLPPAATISPPLVKLERDDCEVLPYVLLYAARMHSIDLRRELVLIRGEKGIVTLTAGAVQGGGRYGLELQMQVAIETLLDEEDMERELDRHPAFRRLAHDALYYLAERWEDADNTLELQSRSARTKFKKYLCSRMATDPPEQTKGSQSASAGKSASRSAKPPKTEPPPDITDSDLDFLWTRVRELARLLSSPPTLLTRARLRGAKAGATATGTVAPPTVAPQTLPPFPEVVLRAVSGDPLLIPLDGNAHCYRWCWYPAGRRIHIPPRRGVAEPEKTAPPWQQHAEFIRAFEKGLANVTKKGVTFADLGTGLNIISTSPPWKIVEEAMNRLKALASKGPYANLDDDADKLAKFDALLKRSADTIAYALCAAVVLRLWSKSERASEMARQSLRTISSALALRHASEASVAEWMKELFQQIRAQFTTDQPPPFPPVADKGGIEAWIKWVRTEMARAESALHRRTLKDLPEIRTRAWEHWYARLSGREFEVVSLDSLICARLDTGPLIYLKLPIEEMTVQEWSEAFHVAINSDPLAKGEEPPPPWLAFAALSHLGFASHVGSLRENSEAIQRLFGRRKLSDPERKALATWLPDVSALTPSRSAFVLRRLKSATVGIWKPDPVFPLLTLSRQQGEALIKDEGSRLDVLRRALYPDLVIFDLTQLLFTQDDEDQSALTTLPPDGPVEKLFREAVLRRPRMSLGIPIVVPPDREQLPPTGYLRIINPKSSEDLFSQLAQQEEMAASNSPPAPP
jgi:Cdc6-like AAA superfamily ATPase